MPKKHEPPHESDEWLEWCRGQEDNLAKALQEEEFAERARDAAYWRPLRQELEALRHQRLIQRKS